MTHWWRCVSLHVFILDNLFRQPMYQLPIPIFHQTSTQRMMFLSPVLETMGYKECFLSEEMTVDSLTPGLPASISLTSCDQALPSKEPTTWPSAVSVPCWQTEQAFHASDVDCCSIPCIMEPGDHLKGVHGRFICRFQTQKGFLLMGLDMFRFNAPLKFPYAVPFTGILLIGLVSVAFLPDRMGKPLAIAHKSVKSQTQGHFPLFNPSITARKTACRSVHISSKLICVYFPQMQQPSHSFRANLRGKEDSCHISFLYSP